VTFPEGLPWQLEYRVGETVRVTLPRRPVQSVSTSGKTDADEVCPQIPLGADAWRRPDGPWQSLDAIPPAWLPFLQRERPSALDYRDPPFKEC
jgi:hypothetical protein